MRNHEFQSIEVCPGGRQGKKFNRAALSFQEHGVDVIPLYDEPFVAIVPAGHPWQDRRDLTGRDLAEDDLIPLGEGNCFRDLILINMP